MFRRQFGDEQHPAVETDETMRLSLALEEANRKLEEAENTIDHQRKTLISARMLMQDPKVLTQKRELEQQNIDILCATIGIRRAVKTVGISRSGHYARKKSKAKKTDTHDTKWRFYPIRVKL